MPLPVFARLLLLLLLLAVILAKHLYYVLHIWGYNVRVVGGEMLLQFDHLLPKLSHYIASNSKNLDIVQTDVFARDLIRWDEASKQSALWTSEIRRRVTITLSEVLNSEEGRWLLARTSVNCIEDQTILEYKYWKVLFDGSIVQARENRYPRNGTEYEPKFKGVMSFSRNIWVHQNSYLQHIKRVLGLHAIVENDLLGLYFERPDCGTLFEHLRSFYIDVYKTDITDDFKKW